MDSEADGTIRSLCLKELAPWLARPVEYRTALEVFAHYNATVRSIFLYRINDRRVSLVDKPGFRVREEYAGKWEPTPSTLDLPVIYREEYERSLMYRDFLQWPIRATELDVNTTLAVDVNDAPMRQTTVPVLGFQKEVGSNTPLLPDPDFLHSYFYIPLMFRDCVPYQQKSATAIFAGSTTSGRTISADDVRALAIPRLRSAVFFKDHPHVDFRLARIVQCDGPDTVALIQELGINADYAGWADQFRHRFILSMDGNGATCSRVAVSLHSNCVLLKYESPHRLYYFDHMVPWRHYVPITSDIEVAELVELERRQPGLFEFIAKEGRSFARRYLTLNSITEYTASLIQVYSAAFQCSSEIAHLSGGPSAPALPRPTITPQSVSAISFGGHVRDLGDLWAWPDCWLGEPGSGRAIEAVVVVPGDDIALDEIEYRVMSHDGIWSEWCEGGVFCGTRGRCLPLTGFCLRPRGQAAVRYIWSYAASFLDGSKSHAFLAGEACQSDSFSALEAIKIAAIPAPEQ